MGQDAKVRYRTKDLDGKHSPYVPPHYSIYTKMPRKLIASFNTNKEAEQWLIDNTLEGELYTAEQALKNKKAINQAVDNALANPTS